VTLIEHLEELRKRIFIALLAWLVGAGVAFYFRTALLDWLEAPLPETIQLNYFKLTEPFAVSMQIAAFFGLVLASPIILGQIWGFIAPGLYREERRWAIPFIFFTVLAFAGGVLFSYYLLLPPSVKILLSFLQGEANAVLTIGSYIATLLTLMAIMGFIFEMPVLGFLLARIGLLQTTLLTRHRRMAILIGVILAAVITPTGDPFSLALVAIPLLLLYELTILVVRLSQRRVPVSEEHVSP
jgi:sec-independent protein translocase protein TatC